MTVKSLLIFKLDEKREKESVVFMLRPLEPRLGGVPYRCPTHTREDEAQKEEIEKKSKKEREIEYCNSLHYKKKY